MRFAAKSWLPVLGLGLAALCLAGSARAADADKLTPADAEVVLSVNVRQILESPLFQKYGKEEAEKALKDEKAKKVTDALGLDPLKDVDSVVVTSAGAEKPKVLVVVHGTFNLDKIQAAAEKFAKDKPAELKITTTDGLTVYEVKNKDGGKDDKPMFVHFVSGGKTLLASTDESYLTLAVKTPSAGPGSEMRTTLDKVSGKESVWLAAVITKELKKQLASNPQAKDLAGKLDAVTGSINVDNDIQTSLVIHTTDAKSAADVKKMLNQVKPLLTLMAQGNEENGPMIGELVENLKITSDKNAVNISLKVSEELIEKANKKEKEKDKDSKDK